MTDKNLSRRALLNTVGGTAAFSGIGMARPQRRTKFKKTDLIEAGVKYRLQNAEQVATYHADKQNEYIFNSKNKKALLLPRASSETKKKFKESGSVINGKGNTVAAQRGKVVPNGKSRNLPISFASQYRVSKYIRSTDAVKEPHVNIVASSKSVKAQTKKGKYRIQAGETEKITLEPRQVKVITKSIGSVPESHPEIPDHELGREINWGTEQVTVVPEIYVSHRGSPEVQEL